MKVLSLASSSKGNAYYIEGREDALLLDCGISCRRICTALAKIPAAKEKLRGVLLTHEHSDHASGLVTFLKKTGLPAYASVATWQALQMKWQPGQVDSELLHGLDSDHRQGFWLGNFFIRSHALSHDAADPLGYVLETEGRKIGLATDTGRLTDDSLEALYDSDLLILEANHDVEWLRRGPYPAFLKARVAGDEGHLSNDACAEALGQILTSRTCHVLLSHLSEKNNHPRLAFDTVYDSLSKASKRQGTLGLWVADPDQSLRLDLPS